MDKENEILILREKIAHYEQILSETAVPIIPSILDETILVPIAGHIGHDRFNMIRTRVLEYVANDRGVERTVFDFTGVGTKDIQEADYNILAIEIGQLNSSLKLMGIRPIYVGFNPHLVKEIVHAGIHVEIETYVNFKTALAVLFAELEDKIGSL